MSTELETTPVVDVQNLPAVTVLYREWRGSMDQHPDALSQLLEYAERQKIGVSGDCLGIYPMDPDAVDESELVWEVAVPVPSDTKPEGDYRVKVLPETLAAVVESTVERAASDGLSLFPWMAEKGYVQTAPTRMIFYPGEANPERVRTTIVLPLKKRTRDIRLPG